MAAGDRPSARDGRLRGPPGREERGGRLERLAERERRREEVGGDRDRGAGAPGRVSARRTPADTAREVESLRVTPTALATASARPRHAAPAAPRTSHHPGATGRSRLAATVGVAGSVLKEPSGIPTRNGP